MFPPMSWYLYNKSYIIFVKTLRPSLWRRCINNIRCVCVCVCVCFLPIHSGHQVRWTHQPGPHRGKVTQGFLIHLLSAVRALIFLARKIQPLLSLVESEVEFCVLTTLFIVLHPLGIFFFFKFLSEKNPVCRGRTHVPTCQRVTRYL